LWIIGALGTMWGALGGLDFLLTNVRDPGYIARLAPDMIDFLDAFPGWVVVAWAMQMGFGLLGSLLLLARSGWAVTAFAVALVGLAASQVYQIAIGPPASMITVGSISLISAVWIIAIARLIYATRMRGRGVLR
jgi:hypothetical protein